MASLWCQATRASSRSHNTTQRGQTDWLPSPREGQRRRRWERDAGCPLRRPPHAAIETNGKQIRRLAMAGFSWSAISTHLAISSFKYSMHMARSYISSNANARSSVVIKRLSRRCQPQPSNHHAGRDDAALSAGRALGYQSAGTVEFIVAPSGSSSLEVNTDCRSNTRSQRPSQASTC